MTTTLLGYNISLGDNQLGVFDHTGPASYQTGGETIPASDFSMGSVAFVIAASYSQSGNYIVLAFYPLSGLATQIILAWYNVATGVQPSAGTNLSSEHIRLEVLGV